MAKIPKQVSAEFQILPWRSNVKKGVRTPGQNLEFRPLDVRTRNRGVRTPDFSHFHIFLILRPFGAKLANAR